MSLAAKRVRMTKTSVAAVAWNTYVASLSPWAWWKLDDGATSTTIADASGNGRTGSYPNGTFSGFPDRLEAPLVDGSTNSLILGGGGNAEIWGPAPFPADLFGGGGSWTFGVVVKTTVTNGVSYAWHINTFNCVQVSLNFNFATFANQAGTISLGFDSTGSQANALTVTGTGWNDGNGHLLLFEYDSVADTISMWLDGVEIGTKARSGTKPAAGNYTGNRLELTRGGFFTGINYDEFLFFNKVLSPTEHANLAGYVL